MQIFFPALDQARQSSSNLKSKEHNASVKDNKASPSVNGTSFAVELAKAIAKVK